VDPQRHYIAVKTRTVKITASIDAARRYVAWSTRATSPDVGWIASIFVGDNRQLENCASFLSS